MGKSRGETEAAGGRHGGKATPHVTDHTATPSGGRSHGENVQNGGGVVNNASGGQRRAGHAAKGAAVTQQASVPSVTSQPVQSGNRVGKSQRNQTRDTFSQQRNQTQASSSQPRNRTGVYSNQQQIQAQTYFNQQQYYRSNHYGGFWFAENTHNDWNRNDQHYWNRHNYRWYDGGWLIIDAGYRPYYSSRGSIASEVQLGLEDQGYYRGPIDGDIGPGTCNARLPITRVIMI